MAFIRAVLYYLLVALALCITGLPFMFIVGGIFGKWQYSTKICKFNSFISPKLVIIIPVANANFFFRFCAIFDCVVITHEFSISFLT